MIIDILSQIERYSQFYSGFQEAFDYLRKGEFILGRQELKTAGLLAICEKVQGHGKNKTQLESHRKYIDIQYIIEGEELIGWNPITYCKKIATPYNEEKDIMYYLDSPSVWLSVPSGGIAIFFPEDTHAPLSGEGPIHRIVIKVPLKD